MMMMSNTVMNAALNVTRRGAGYMCDGTPGDDYYGCFDDNWADHVLLYLDGRFMCPNCHPEFPKEEVETATSLKDVFDAIEKLDPSVRVGEEQKEWSDSVRMVIVSDVVVNDPSYKIVISGGKKFLLETGYEYGTPQAAFESIKEIVYVVSGGALRFSTKQLVMVPLGMAENGNVISWRVI